VYMCVCVRHCVVVHTSGCVCMCVCLYVQVVLCMLFMVCVCASKLEGSKGSS